MLESERGCLTKQTIRQAFSKDTGVYATDRNGAETKSPGQSTGALLQGLFDYSTVKRCTVLPDAFETRTMYTPSAWLDRFRVVLPPVVVDRTV